MSWEEYSLSEVSKYWMGKTDASLMNSEIFISTENMISEKGGIVKSSYVPNSGKVNSYSENDILVSNIRPYFKKIWLAQKTGGCSNDVLVFRPDEKKVLPKFLYYQLSCDSFFNDMVAGSNGTKMPRGNKVSIMNYRIPCPPLPIQKRIADILSTYDTLIENNLQRIKHLEAMAKCEYKMLMKESEVEIRKLSDIASVNSNAIPSKFNGSIQYIDIASVGTGCINELQEFDFKDAPSRAKRIVKDGDIIWSCVRPNRKSFALIQAPSINTIASTGFAVITPSKVPSSFLYQALTTDEFVKYLESHAQGSAYPAVSAKDFENSFIEVPIKVQSLTWFEQSVSKYFKQKHNLESQNTHLRQIRDTLLPKLMSGQIDVSQTIRQAKVVEMPLPKNKGEKKKDSTDKPKAGAKYYFRTVLASYIVNKLWQENTFGHVKLMKLMFLCEHLAEIETVSNYHRDAAGPYDNQMIRSIDKQMQEKKWFEMYKHEGKYPKYRPLQNYAEHQAEFLKYYGEKQSGVDSLIERFRKESTEKAEMVATIYEAWRGLKDNPENVTVENILDEVLNKWHDNKQRISSERWIKCYEWMQEKGWVQ